MTSYRRRCDVITSHRRLYDIILRHVPAGNTYMHHIMFKGEKHKISNGGGPSLSFSSCPLNLKRICSVRSKFIALREPFSWKGYVLQGSKQEVTTDARLCRNGGRGGGVWCRNCTCIYTKGWATDLFSGQNCKK